MEKEIKFQLKGIEILDVALYHHITDDISPVNFNVNLEHRTNIKENLIQVICSVEVLSQDKESSLGFFKAACTFSVQNLSEHIDSEKKPALPAPVITTFNSVTISTVRGMMFSQFKGTSLHAAILPLIDTSAMLKEI